jgi:hypothetical protein
MKKIRMIVALFCLGFAFEALASGGGGAAADSVGRLKKLSDQALDALEKIYSQTESYKNMFAEVQKVLSSGGNVVAALACARKQEARIVIDIRGLINEKRSDLSALSRDFTAGNIIGLSVKAVGQLVARMFWKVGENLVAQNVYFDLEPVRAVMQAMNVASAEIAEIKPAAQAEGFTVQVVDGQTVYQFPKIQKLKDLKSAVKTDIPGIDLFTLTYFGKGKYDGAVVEKNKIFESCLQSGGAFSLQRLVTVVVYNDAPGQKLSQKFRVKDLQDVVTQFNVGNDNAWEVRLIGFFFKSLVYDLYLLNRQERIVLNDPETRRNYNFVELNELLKQNNNQLYVRWKSDFFTDLVKEVGNPPAPQGGGAVAPVLQAPVQAAQPLASATVNGGVPAASAPVQNRQAPAVQHVPAIAPAQAQPVQQAPAVQPIQQAPVLPASGNPADDLQRLWQMLSELNQQAQ